MDSSLNTTEAKLDLLLKQSVRFSFFQALRSIESCHAELPRIGHGFSPSHERYRIRQSADLAFAPSTIDRASQDEQGNISIDQRFFGLLGPSGPLPLHWTEMIRNRGRHASDETLQAFLDIFHHRMASLFYRAWSSARAAIQRDRPRQDRFAMYLAAFSGNGMRNGRGRDAWDDDSKNYFAGHLASLRRNGEGLASMIESVVKVPVTIKPFALRWLPLSCQERTRLAARKSSFAKKCTANSLGQSAVLGERVPDRQGLIEVRLGPMGYSSFERLMPHLPERDILRAVVRTHSGTSIDAIFRPVLRKEEVPRLQLGVLGQIGRNAWIQSRPIEHDRDDYRFDTCRAGSTYNSREAVGAIT